jgi:dTDP-4-amino-4,6-dideoxygalactose transaminase
VSSSSRQQRRAAGQPLVELPFNRPHTTGREFEYIAEAIDNGWIAGNGPFGDRCAEWLQERTGCVRALMTPSCTAALEMAALLAGIEKGDEVIMPSFTFVTTASSVVRVGGRPVFVDIRPDTLNLDEAVVEQALSPRTKAIMPVHYAGVGCEMEALLALAERHRLLVIEDAAHGLLASYDDRPLGSLGQLGCVSFHETKGVMCGEGGALLVNDPALVEQAEIVQEKGTNRSQFFRGEVDKYSWVDLGSSFVSSEINAAFLFAQLEAADSITAERMEIWERYHAHFAELEQSGRLRRPIIPPGRRHNAHMYYLLMRNRDERDRVIAQLGDHGVHAVFHYVPLHDSPAGRRYGRQGGPLTHTVDVSERLMRLPLWIGMTEADVDRVAEAVADAL